MPETAGGSKPAPDVPTPLSTTEVPVPDTPNNAGKRQKIEIVVDTDKLTPAQKAKLMKAIEALLGMRIELSIVPEKPGSVKLTLEMPLPQAQALLRAVRAGKLQQYDVVDARLIERRERAEASSAAPQDDEPPGSGQERTYAPEERSGKRLRGRT